LIAPALFALVAAVPCIYWTQGIESRPALESAGIKRVCVPADQVENWRKAGFTVTAVTDTDFAAREALPAPGTTARPGVASPTRAPWIVASGWRFMRAPAVKYSYTVPAGKAAFALAEAFAYRADAVLKIDPADVAAAGSMMAFLDTLPTVDLPAVADFGVVDDNSPVTAEVMNLLARRNLLFEVEKAPSTRYRINVTIGGAGYSREEAADPSSFAQKIRGQLTDDQRSLRIYGSEVVIARLTGDGKRARLHLVNYGGREIDGLRVRVRGPYQSGDAYIAGSGKTALVDPTSADGAMEFSLPKIGAYAVVDLR
jgi:hypothetical protein